MKRRGAGDADRPLAITSARVYPGQVLDGSRPILISIDVDVRAPGTLRGRMLVRSQKVSQVDFAVDPIDVEAAGPLRLIAEIPSGSLGGGKHGVDVELWLGDAAAVLRAGAARFVVDGQAARPASCLREAAAWTRGSSA